MAEGGAVKRRRRRGGGGNRRAARVSLPARARRAWARVGFSARLGLGRPCCARCARCATGCAQAGPCAAQAEGRPPLPFQRGPVLVRVDAPLSLCSVLGAENGADAPFRERSRERSGCSLLGRAEASRHFKCAGTCHCARIPLRHASVAEAAEPAGNGALLGAL